MQYWDIVIVITALVGLFATVLPFFTKLNRTLGELNATVEQMQKVISNFEKNSRETHDKIHDRLDDHETRISHLEGGKR
jgi:uncharacterized protein YoxC